MATFEGSLSKWTNVMKGWQYRWFVLDEHAGLLSYYTVSIVLIVIFKAIGLYFFKLFMFVKKYFRFSLMHYFNVITVYFQYNVE